MAEVASAYVSLLPSARGFGGKLDSAITPAVGASGKKAGKTFGGTFGNAIKGTLAGLGIAKIGSEAIQFLGDSLSEGREAEKVGARTANVIKSMGLESKVTAAQVGDLSTAISNKTGIDDEQIQSTANLLLGFDSVGKTAGTMGGTFQQATGLATDMAAALDKTAKGGAIQLGRALEDPVKGLTTLTRAGVTFTDQQADQVKKLVAAGETTKAQGIILDEVAKKFGGAAESMANPSEKARVVVDNLKEQIGTALIPVVDKLATFVSEKIIPAVSSFITGMQTGKGSGGQFADAMKTLWGNLKDVWAVIKPIFEFIGDHQTLMVNLATAVGVVAAAVKVWRIAQTLLNIVLSANPIGLIIIGIAALVAGLIIAYKKSETFRNIVDTALKGIQAAFRFMWNNVVQPVLKFFIEGLADAMDMVGGLFDALSHVPGFGWAGELGDKMHGAADAARGLADNIKKIPSSKTVNIVVNVSQHNKNGNMLGPVVTRSANGSGGGPLNVGGKYGRNLGDAVVDGFTTSFKTNGKKMSDAVKAQVDKLKGKLSTLKSDMSSLADSVASAFKSDVFSGGSRELFGGLFTDVANLKAVKDAFAKLTDAGISKGFLSELFQSGNTDLILSLAANPTSAATASDLFGQREALAESLGQQIGLNQFGDRIDAVKEEIAKLRGDVAGQADRQAILFADVLNSSARTADRGRRGNRKWAAQWA